MNRKRLFKTLLILAAILWVALALAPPLLAADEASEDYRPFFFGIENRTVVWIIAQLHLMFGAFVLGVPLFASIVELIGMMTGDPRYDRLSHEFTRLLSAAFSTTAALGGALAFALIGLYPAFMNHLSGAFHKTYYIYAGFFFVEAFALYSYYYSWNRLQGKKPGFGLAGIFNLFLTGTLFAAVGYLVGGFASMVIESIPRWAGSTSGIPGGLDHSLKIGVAGAAVILFIWKWSKAALENRKWLHFNLGIVVNLAGITLMFIANSWATYMMSPPHVSAATGMHPDYWSEGGRFLGTAWEAVNNALWMPVNIHRLIANVAFGGFVVSAYAAIKYLGAKRFADRAHYDWMGYIGSFVGMAALLPLPFAGYYLGRELYSYSATMGQDMMGGTFSWTFIIQAILIAMLFIGINFYLWSGLGRIRGSEKYSLHILVMLTLLVICFGIWSTPHNLPMSAEERNLVGSQFHPSLARFGLMSAKNAVVYFIIVTTFFSFLIYRRANKGKPIPFREHGKPAIITLGILGAFCTWLLLNKAFDVWHLDPSTINVDGKKIIQVLGVGMSVKGFLDLSGWFLVVHICALWAGIVLALKNKGILGQGVIFGSTVAIVTFVFAWYGFVAMKHANEFLRDIAVVQVFITISCLIVVTGIDIFLFRGAKTIAGIRWGKMTAASQYALITVCLAIVLLMGLMGYIRSGLRKDWHVFSVLRDTSASAYTPTIFEMAKIVGFIVVLFLGLLSFVFWLSSLGEKDEEIPDEWYAEARDEMAADSATVEP